MKFFRFTVWAVLMASLVMGGVGCKRKPKPVTQIGSNGIAGNPPGTGSSTQSGPILDSGRPINNPNLVTKTTPFENLPPVGDGVNKDPLAQFDIGNFDPDPSFFKANTVYFDYDRATVRAAERVRIDEVAAYLKGKPTYMVQIEGHCDERGTEEYNRSLGERRALAVREYLINSGVEAQRVHTISYGEDRPAEIGSSEGAWAKNRRGEFILLKPRQ
ncbi:MAG TPA: peptidoglycan-associated lipoprotein Pal [Verrucomicrobiae bacterium]